MDNALEGPPSRKKSLTATAESTPSNRHGGPTAPTPALANRKDRPTTTEDLPSHPPLEEIEMWVPNPNAKFGPPKRKRTASKRRDPKKKERRVDVAVPVKTPVPTPMPPPSLSQPLSLTVSQVVALREEEEESQSQLQSQSQPTSNQPGGTVNDSATKDALPPTVKTKDVTRPTNPNVNNGRGSETSGQGANLQSNIPDPIKQVLSATNDSQGYRFNPLLPSPLSSFHPNTSTSANSPSKSLQTGKSTQGEGVNAKDTHRFKPQISVFNNIPPASALSSSKSSQTEKSVKIGPPRNGKPGTSSTKQRSPPRSEPPQTGEGFLANLRTLMARARLDELRRAGKGVGNNVAEGHPTLTTSQNSEPPPHVVYKQVMDGMESPNNSQVTHLGNSANEMSASASPENRRVDPSKSQEGLVINKSGQDVNLGSVSRTGGVLATKVLVVRGDVATAPCRSQS